jgi:hypothetical protein
MNSPYLPKKLKLRIRTSAIPFYTLFELRLTALGKTKDLDVADESFLATMRSVLTALPLPVNKSYFVFGAKNALCPRINHRLKPLIFSPSLHTNSSTLVKHCDLGLLITRLRIIGYLEGCCLNLYEY